MRMRWAILLALGILLAAPSASVRASEDGERPWNAVRVVFRDRLDSEDPVERGRAFECLRGRSEPEALDELLRGYRKVRADGDRIRNQQERTERSYEMLLKKLFAAHKSFSEGSKGPRQIEQFNKKEKKYSAEIEQLRSEGKDLENDWSRNRALLDSATDVASSILSALAPEPTREALETLRSTWLDSRDPEGPMRWMDTLGSARSPLVIDELKKVLGTEGVPQGAHIAALQALAECGDPTAPERAKAMLKLPPDDFPVVGAAIAVLKRMHHKDAIPPLIEFLKREDLGRLRDDARAALVSLTGQEHGPYFDPWHRWWSENEQGFVMPAEPTSIPPSLMDKKSKTFYGIHSFSDRVLYIVDVSESMSWAPGKRGVPGGPAARILKLREELVGAVNGLDDGANFNVIAFNHEVVTWNGHGVATANETAKRKLARWVGEMEPTGLTNIHDALEAGFRLILRTTGRPPFDTIFFLTDGKPTGGKITDPALILDEVRDWNSVANITIHVIGIGRGEDVDQAFLQKLAEIGNGKYIQRDK